MTLSIIQTKIEHAEKSSGRTIGSTQLIAVSKVQPNERVLNVLGQGHKIFGENKVQEAHSKWPMFRENFSDVEVHLIGPLQSNKVKQAVELFDAIHTVDRLKLAQKLSNEIQAQGKHLICLFKSIPAKKNKNQVYFQMKLINSLLIAYLLICQSKV